MIGGGLSPHLHEDRVGAAAVGAGVKDTIRPHGDSATGTASSNVRVRGAKTDALTHAPFVVNTPKRYVRPRVIGAAQASAGFWSGSRRPRPPSARSATPGGTGGFSGANSVRENGPGFAPPASLTTIA